MSEENTPETTPPEGAGVGAEPQATEQNTGATSEQNNQEPSKPSSLADVLAGLDDEAQRIVRAEVNKRNTENQKLRERAKALEPKAKAHDEAQEAQRSAEERAEERAQAAESRARAAVERSVRAEVHAAAADKFVNPANAAPLLGDLAGYVDDQGDVDTDRITADVTALLTDNPHLAKPTTPAPRAPAPNPAQGSSSSGPTKTSGTDVGREMFANRRGKKTPAA